VLASVHPLYFGFLYEEGFPSNCFLPLSNVLAYVDTAIGKPDVREYFGNLFPPGQCLLRHAADLSILPGRPRDFPEKSEEKPSRDA
jgi:hypothetical protein